MPRMNPETVARWIGRLADHQLSRPAQAPHSPEYLTAMGAVLTLLERHAGLVAGVPEAVAKARLAWSAMGGGDSRDGDSDE